MTMMLAIFVVMNIAGLFIMGVDKKRARKHQYRIRERTLWLVALFGGAIGTTAGMQIYRHKTKHTSFKVGFPVLAIIEFVLFIKILL
ncbi:DUF1294 domain-containing protein [Neobacillus sp. MM2021_6]|uniref:DUF1294 domain-containing protein n=1 Tax=Bacillaceae TaxID=186817 RepID=UPI00140C73B5|nr:MULTISPECIES: DUF1294 domain-containing protein [Bacillaceae]MBO0960129.1 DUF1294 domain-containing protein [Neobacillus sp. MM2021_6]NHC17539.1 DUF1294 domain-containing protein [Bacillus sp. MM2020_4]